MAQDYEVTQVSQQPPREWEGQHGKIYYIKVALKGHSKPVEIGKKSPGALKVGDTVYGTVENTTYPSDKFKSAPKPFSGGANKVDGNEIKAQMAIKASVQLWQGKEWAITDIEETAKSIYLMIDRVKYAKPVADSPGEVEEVPDDDAEFQSLIEAGF